MKTTQVIYIYKITCTMTGRICIGQSTNPQRRYKQHMRTPPIRMKADAQKYIPFKSHFVLEILHSCAHKAESDRVEAETIMTLKTLGKHGYNVMKGNPTKDPKFNYLRSRKINLST